jgi:nitrogen fixation protein FixH
MNGAKLWPVAVVAVLAVTVAANIVLLVQAGDPGAAGIEPDYYRRAVAWDSTMAQERRNLSLGWRLAAELGVATPAGTPLVVRLAGPDGAPLDGATIEVEAIHNLEAARPALATLHPTPDGAYAAWLPLARRGRWELRFTVVRAGERFTARVHREAAEPTP